MAPSVRRKPRKFRLWKGILIVAKELFNCRRTSGDAEFRRVRALAYVDLNRTINGRLGSDWKPRAGDLRNVDLERSRSQPRRPRRRIADDNFSVGLSFINEKLVLGLHLRDEKTECADGGNNSRLFHGDVSGNLILVSPLAVYPPFLSRRRQTLRW